MALASKHLSQPELCNYWEAVTPARLQAPGQCLSPSLIDPRTQSSAQ